MLSSSILTQTCGFPAGNGHSNLETISGMYSCAFRAASHGAEWYSPEVCMKRFSCGDVVPGCTKKFSGTTNEEILAAVAQHARADHGLANVPDDVVQAVLKNIHDDSAAG